MRKVVLISLIAAALYGMTFTASAQTVVEQAQTLSDARQFGAAITLLTTYLDTHENDAEALRALGNVYIASGQWDDAIRAQEKAAKMRPDDVEYRMALAAAYREKARRSGGFSAMRNAKKWKKELENCYEKWPNNVDVRFWLVNYLLNAPGFGGGDKGRGLEIAQATVSLDDFRGRMLTAYAHRLRKEYGASIAQYDVLLEQYPDSATVYGARGRTDLSRGRIDDAIDWFMRWIAQTERDPEAYTVLGDTYLEQKDYEKALPPLQKALEIDPYWSEARYSIAQIYDEQKNYSAARKEYEFVAIETPEFRLAGKAKKRAYQLKKKRY